MARTWRGPPLVHGSARQSEIIGSGENEYYSMLKPVSRGFEVDAVVTRRSTLAAGRRGLARFPLHNGWLQKDVERGVSLRILRLRKSSWTWARRGGFVRRSILERCPEQATRCTGDCKKGLARSLVQRSPSDHLERYVEVREVVF